VPSRQRIVPMRNLLLSVIRAYVWVSGIGERRRIRKKMARLRERDPYNYTTY
jgi:hypothetical protein